MPRTGPRDPITELEDANHARLTALAGAGTPVAPAMLNDLRIVSYLETVLEILADDGLRRAQHRFEANLSAQLDQAEKQSEAMLALARKAGIASGAGGLVVPGRI